MSSMPFMNIRNGYVSKKGTFDTQYALEEKIDGHTSMMSNLTAQDDVQTKQFKPKIYQTKRRGQTRKLEIMVKEIIKIDIGQVVETWEYCLVVEYSMDRIIEIGPGAVRTAEMISGEEILEGTWEQIKIIEEDIGKTIGTIIMKEVEVGIEKDTLSIKKQYA